MAFEPTVASASRPWTSGHAPPEDRALGIELELIELVRRRDAGLARAEEVDEEIAVLLDRLADYNLLGAA
jgi:hypothetical protein